MKELFWWTSPVFSVIQSTDGDNLLSIMNVKENCVFFLCYVLKLVFSSIMRRFPSSARLMNVSIDAMSATRMRMSDGPYWNGSIMTSSFCKTPTNFVGRVKSGIGFFKALLASDRLEFVPGLLENGSDTIAVTGVYSCICNGSLQYNNATTDKWISVTSLRPENALVVGNGSSFRCVMNFLICVVLSTCEKNPLAFYS